MDERSLFDQLQEANLQNYLKISGLTASEIIEAVKDYRAKRDAAGESWKINDSQYKLFGEDHLD